MTRLLISGNQVVMTRLPHFREPFFYDTICLLQSEKVLTSFGGINRIGVGQDGYFYNVGLINVNLQQHFGIGPLYVAKVVKNREWEAKDSIGPIARFSSKLSQCATTIYNGVIQLIAVICSVEEPTSIFPYWNEGNMQEMLLRMEGRQSNQFNPNKGEFNRLLPMYLGYNLKIFKKLRLEISLALMEMLKSLEWGLLWTRD